MTEEYKQHLKYASESNGRWWVDTTGRLCRATPGGIPCVFNNEYTGWHQQSEKSVAAPIGWYTPYHVLSAREILHLLGHGEWIQDKDGKLWTVACHRICYWDQGFVYNLPLILTGCVHAPKPTGAP